MRHQVKNNNGNCFSLANTLFLHVNDEDVSSIHLVRNYELKKEPENYKHDYAELPVVDRISEYKVCDNI